VKSGFTTVNDPLKYDGYRFHQVAFFPDGAQLTIRDTATGNTVFDETFPLQDNTAAPVVTISDASGRALLTDTVAPTDFLDVASGTLVRVPETGRVLWIGITTDGNDAWQLVAFDPQQGDAGTAVRIPESGDAALSGLNIRFDDVTSIPSALGVGLPGGDKQVLAQMIDNTDGATTLQLVSSDRPAITLAQGQPVTVDGLEYTFQGRREFTGISVKRDSGAWFIWIATGMLLAGLAVTFYVPRRRLWLKLTGADTRIAALAEKSGGFEKDMRALATRIGVPVPPEIQEER